MEMLIGMGFILCMLYLFYEREGRSKSRGRVTRSARTSASKGASKGTSRGKGTTKRRSAKRQLAWQVLAVK